MMTMNPAGALPAPMLGAPKGAQRDLPVGRSKGCPATA